jgi:hypothetical protein
MSFQDHLETLRARHADLEAAVRQEIARPLPDEQRLTDLKRQKLRLKDMIFAMTRRAGEEAPTSILQQIPAEPAAATAQPRL